MWTPVKPPPNLVYASQPQFNGGSPGYLTILIDRITLPDKAVIIATLYPFQITATMVKTNIV
jgi:hypothetical protein